jgi:hypothetical protein
MLKISDPIKMPFFLYKKIQTLPDLMQLLSKLIEANHMESHTNAFLL